MSSLSDCKELQETIEALAKYAQQLILFVKTDASLLVGQSLQRVLQEFGVLTELVESSLKTFSAQISTFTITSIAAKTDSNEFLRLNSLGASLSEQLRALIPITIAILNAANLDPERKQLLMSNFVGKLKTYSATVSQLRDLGKSLYDLELAANHAASNAEATNHMRLNSQTSVSPQLQRRPTLANAGYNPTLSPSDPYRPTSPVNTNPSDSHMRISGNSMPMRAQVVALLAQTSNESTSPRGANSPISPRVPLQHSQTSRPQSLPHQGPPLASLLSPPTQIAHANTSTGRSSTPVPISPLISSGNNISVNVVETIPRNAPPLSNAEDFNSGVDSYNQRMAKNSGRVLQRSPSATAVNDSMSPRSVPLNSPGRSMQPLNSSNSTNPISNNISTLETRPTSTSTPTNFGAQQPASLSRSTSMTNVSGQKSAMPSFFMNSSNKLTTFLPGATSVPLQVSSNLNVSRLSNSGTDYSISPTGSSESVPIRDLSSGRIRSSSDHSNDPSSSELLSPAEPRFDIEPIRPNSSNSNSASTSNTSSNFSSSSNSNSNTPTSSIRVITPSPRVSGAEMAPAVSSPSAGEVARYRRPTVVGREKRLTEEEEIELAKSLEKSISDWETIGDEKKTEPPSALALNIQNKLAAQEVTAKRTLSQGAAGPTRPEPIKRNATDETTRTSNVNSKITVTPAGTRPSIVSTSSQILAPTVVAVSPSSSSSVSSSSVSDNVQSNLLSDDFTSQLEKSSNDLFDITQSIATRFATLGVAMQKTNAADSKRIVDEIADLSQTLLIKLDEFKFRFVNDPLLVSSFTDLSSKFESCAVSFGSTATRVIASLNSQSQLELSASTRAFSSGISNLLEFLVRLKKELIDNASNARQRKLNLTKKNSSQDMSVIKGVPPRLSKTQSERNLFITSKETASAPLSSSTPPEGLDGDHSVDDIWTETQNEQTIVFEVEGDGSTHVKLGTLNQLVINLTHETKTDMEYMKTFLATYHSFTTTDVLIHKLIMRFHVPSSVRLSEAQIKVVRLRVINAFKIWFKMRFDDFTTELLQPILEFLEDIKTDPQWNPTADGLLKMIDAKMEEVVRLNALESGKKERSIIANAPAKASPTELLFAIEPTVFAQQLSRLEFSIWKKLKPSELMNQSWTKADLKHKSPHVCELISRFNSVSHWVASVILWQEKLVDRVRVVTRLLDIAIVLDAMNNFNSLLEILAGFANSAVHRLKFTFGDLSRRHQQQLERLQKKMDSTHNYKVYRDELRNCNPPVLPYLGVYLTDLTFIEDGNKNNLQGLINFNKRRQLYRVLREIEQYQSQPYDLTVIPNVMAFLSELPHNDNDELFRISLLREPRGIESKASIL